MFMQVSNPKQQISLECHLVCLPTCNFSRPTLPLVVFLIEPLAFCCSLLDLSEVHFEKLPTSSCLHRPDVALAFALTDLNVLHAAREPFSHPDRRTTTALLLLKPSPPFFPTRDAAKSQGFNALLISLLFPSSFFPFALWVSRHPKSFVNGMGQICPGQLS